MHITHVEAHKLIQYDLDQALDPEGLRSLSSHLQNCESCRRYAKSLRNVENQLRHSMSKQWNHYGPLPLSIDVIKPKPSLTRNTQNLFQFRTALVSVVLVAFSFFIWQLTSTPSNPLVQSPSTIFPAPTPSTQISTVSMEPAECEWTLYKVKPTDTLEDIAFNYSVSMQDIMAFNKMDSAVVNEAMEIKIPQCTATPTMTARLPTTTLTPKLDVVIDTPG